MKNYSEDVIRGSRPDKSAEHTIGYCLKCLLADTQHKITDEVVAGLNFEELLGALLQAEDLVKELAELEMAGSDEGV